MTEKFSKVNVVVPLVASSVIGLISYVLICSALRPRGWSFWSSTSLSDYERYFAIGLALLISLIVLYRMCRDEWGREQLDKLMDFDDTGT